MIKRSMVFMFTLYMHSYINSTALRVYVLLLYNMVPQWRQGCYKRNAGSTLLSCCTERKKTPVHTYLKRIHGHDGSTYNKFASSFICG